MNFGADRGGGDVKDSGVGFVQRVEGAVYVLGIDRCRETVLDAVGNLDGFVQRVGGNHRRYRAEDFFLGDAHVRGDVGEDGWLDEISVRVVTFGQMMTAAL